MSRIILWPDIPFRICSDKSKPFSSIRKDEYLPTPLKKMIELLDDAQRTDGGTGHGTGTG